MMLLVRNKVQDVKQWKEVFDGQNEAADVAGLKILHVWQSADEPDQVFFLMDVEDRGKADAYMSSPDATSVGERAGVVDGEFHYLEALD